LLTGNATCANRGDSAIFRGLIHEIKSQSPNAELICCSRHPIASSTLLQRPLHPDWIYESQLVSGSNLKKAKGLIKKKWNQKKLLWKQNNSLLSKFVSVPTSAQEFVERIKGVDAVIHVGGSFFVDLYGVRQFDVMMACASAKIPVYLVGHSMGPFQLPGPKKFSKAFLPTVKKIFLREQTSRSMLDELGVELNNLANGSDTAWLMPHDVASPIAAAELSEVVKPMVAVTVRKLAPFDKRLGISQTQYEENVAALLDSVIEKGFHIIGVSMCTGIGGYVHDDRLVANAVRQKLKNPDSMTILWHEYNDLEVGNILKQCQLLIGTRLHSAILALRYGTPALALYYEHKSEGVLKQLGLDDWSVRLQEVGNSKTKSLVSQILRNPIQSNERVKNAVDAERLRAQEMIKWVLEDVNRQLK
ncbi:polysaccharide pyruvyl transferase family protein, partial [Mariniblastus sp.]|nr:polysaccharide pyruvyl transferase family protein [Mariniblastus sp.]